LSAPVNQERIISKLQTDYIFKLNKSEWEDFAKKLHYPGGMAVRIFKKETGSRALVYHIKNNTPFLSMEVFYRAPDFNKPYIFFLWIFYPIGTFQDTTEAFLNKVAHRAMMDLEAEYGVKAFYSVWDNNANLMSPTMEIILLAVQKK